MRSRLPDHAAADEAVLDTEHVRIFVRVRHTDVCQLYVQVLVNLNRKEMAHSKAKLIR